MSLLNSKYVEYQPLCYSKMVKYYGVKVVLFLWVHSKQKYKLFYKKRNPSFFLAYLHTMAENYTFACVKFKQINKSVWNQ